MNKQINSILVDSLFNKESIAIRAKNQWNEKSLHEKEKAFKKYRHILLSKKINDYTWLTDFDNLLPFQKFLLMKGEIIRTYDNFRNIEKTHLKEKFKLNEFQTKWHKLTHLDKMKLLTVLNMSD